MRAQIHEMTQLLREMEQEKHKEIWKLQAELDLLNGGREGLMSERHEWSTSGNETIRPKAKTHQQGVKSVCQNNRPNADLDRTALSKQQEIQQRLDEIDQDGVWKEDQETTRSPLKAGQQENEEIQLLQETLNASVREQGRTQARLHDITDALITANEDKQSMALKQRATEETLEDVRSQYEEMMLQKEQALEACDEVNALLAEMVASMEKTEASNELLNDEIREARSKTELLTSENTILLRKLEELGIERNLLSAAVDQLKMELQAKNEAVNSGDDVSLVTAESSENSEEAALLSFPSKIEKTKDELNSLLSKFRMTAVEGSGCNDKSVCMDSLINEKLSALNNDFNEAMSELLVLRENISTLDKEMQSVKEMLRVKDDTINDFRQCEQVMHAELEEIQTSFVALLAALTESESSRSSLRTTTFSEGRKISVVDEKGFAKRDDLLLGTVAMALDGTLPLQNVKGTFKAQMVGHLVALVQVLYQRMTKTAVLEQTDHVMTILLQGLSVPNAEEKVFMAIGTVMCCVQDAFVVCFHNPFSLISTVCKLYACLTPFTARPTQKYLADFLPLLVSGLKSFEQGSLCTTCTGVVVDLCVCLRSSIQPYADDVVQAMFHTLRSGLAKDHNVKAVVISCFGDIALSIGAAFEPYMESTMMILMQASQTQVNVTNDGMISLTTSANAIPGSAFAFSNKLRCAALEAYSGILVGLGESRAVHIFVPYAHHVLMFLSCLALDKTKDDAVLQNAVALLGDIVCELGDRPEIRKELESDFASNLLEEASRSTKIAIQDKAQWIRDAMAQNAKHGHHHQQQKQNPTTRTVFNGRRKTQ